MIFLVLSTENDQQKNWRIFQDDKLFLTRNRYGG